MAAVIHLGGAAKLAPPSMWYSVELGMDWEELEGEEGLCCLSLRQRARMRGGVVAGAAARPGKMALVVRRARPSRSSSVQTTVDPGDQGVLQEAVVVLVAPEKGRWRREVDRAKQARRRKIEEPRPVRSEVERAAWRLRGWLARALTAQEMTLGYREVRRLVLAAPARPRKPSP